MYELTIERFLHLSHALRLYDGAYEPVHNHRWQVQVQVSAPALDEIGGVMDFNVLDGMVAQVLAEFEGRLMNELPEFAGGDGRGVTNSSSERMAEVIYKRVALLLAQGAGVGMGENVKLDHVTLIRDEAIRARFTYRPG